MGMDTVTKCEAGDILFYGSGNGSLEDQVIAAWTNSPYVHVAVAVSDTEMVQALSGGVNKAPIHTPDAMWSYQEHIAGGNLQRGIEWIKAQVGSSYGFIDIFDAVVERFEKGVTLVGDHYDCSALAAEFLIQCGDVPEMLNVTNPHTITPADLAKLLNVSEDGRA